MLSLCLGTACMTPGLHLYCTNTLCSAMLYTTAFLHRSVSSCREEQEGDLFAICIKTLVPARDLLVREHVTGFIGMLQAQL